MKKKQTAHLAGKIVQTVWRHRSSELVIQFTDGSRIFADVKEDALEHSITGCSND
ncbi:hypothetical protein JH265_02565 [Xanthomonas campestris pv. campestris]|uniref:hypothetical protein n=1 Tax=Xanthomonas campestris TaxID=339 RepID=UPI00237811EC|nr:hypothetical protein [Xanthomonas campestris]MDO0863478.1 hypothetical protein [Xanthomonas campestris pv. campestris]MEB1202919.1 hypothetical protein [Xanthomonas campestris pv. campestris]MEB1273505.1 hypothetical protein [Xanthomonas campestris pv. campestris]MEB1484919.1 hypothetical protein [Xanthomonas campestris pv. campestris]MEB1505449.1 hypothetical protein [Xanthomonas campestris pv. campestris]